jgi:hypothetical protein
LLRLLSLSPFTSRDRLVSSSHTVVIAKNHACSTALHRDLFTGRIRQRFSAVDTLSQLSIRAGIQLLIKGDKTFDLISKGPPPNDFKYSDHGCQFGAVSLSPGKNELVVLAQCHPLGRHELRGLATPRDLFAPGRAASRRRGPSKRPPLASSSATTKGQALAFVYCADELDRQADANLLTRDEARRICGECRQAAGTRSAAMIAAVSLDLRCPFGAAGNRTRWQSSAIPVEAGRCSP